MHKTISGQLSFWGMIAALIGAIATLTISPTTGWVMVAVSGALLITAQIKKNHQQ